MQLQTISREIESNLPPSAAFTIANNGKMFAILADKIYTDKPRAVIREICCNALDIHSFTGQREPFLVSLPSQLEPQLSIRDYGTGLTDEEMTGLYTTFFDSTKGANNDQVGGFGLGSKAPFAYTDAFTVTSYQGGVKRVYALFRGDDFIPQISCASISDTDEMDGLEVKVPVKSADWSRFKTIALDVLRWFPPESFTLFGATVDHIKPAVLTPTWMLRPATNENKHEVLMGPVAYGLDWYKVSTDIELPIGIVPIFQVGELDLPPSREGISYDPVTISRLKARAEEIAAELAPLLLAKGEIMQPIERLQYITELKAGGMTPLFTAYHKAQGHDKDDHGLAYDKKKWGTFFERRLEEIVIPAPLTSRQRSRGRRTYAYNIDRSGHSLTGDGLSDVKRLTESWWIFNDLTESRAPRIYDRLNELDAKDVYYLVEPSSKITSAADLAAFLPEVNSDHFINLSDIYLAPKVAKRMAGDTRLYRAEHHQSNSHPNFNVYEAWNRTAPTEGLWVPFVGCEPKAGSSARVGLGWTDDYVWGLTIKAQKEVLDNDWEALDVFIQRKADEAIADPITIPAIHARLLGAKLNEDADLKHIMAFCAANPALFPVEHAAITAAKDDALLLSQLEYDRLRKTAALGFITIPPMKDTHNVTTLLKKCLRRNKALNLLLRVQARDTHVDPTNPIVKALCK